MDVDIDKGMGMGMGMGMGIDMHGHEHGHGPLRSKAIRLRKAFYIIIDEKSTFLLWILFLLVCEIRKLK
jgi:hypothetical protein